MGVIKDSEDDLIWILEQLEELEIKKYEYIKMMYDLGYGKWYWDDIIVGDELLVCIIGLYSIVSFVIEWCVYLFIIWGGIYCFGMDMELFGFIKEMVGYENDLVMEKDNFEWIDGVYFGLFCGYLFLYFVCKIGMFWGYGYGVLMGVWIFDYLVGWVGEWGQVVYCNLFYCGLVFIGDSMVMIVIVEDKLVDVEGCNIIQVVCKMIN